MASPARLCRRVSVVEVPALHRRASSSSRVAPPHQRSSRHGRPHIGRTRFCSPAGQTAPASFLPLGYPSARWPWTSRSPPARLCRRPRASLAAQGSDITLLQPSESTHDEQPRHATPVLRPPRSLPLRCTSCRPHHHRSSPATNPREASPARPAHEPAELPTHTTSKPESRVEDPTLGEREGDVEELRAGDGEEGKMRRWGMESGDEGDGGRRREIEERVEGDEG